MARGKKSPTQRQRLQALAKFLPIFESDGFKFGGWVHPPSEEPNVIIMGYYALSAESEGFVDAACKNGWVLPDFDWGKWLSTAEAAELRDNREVLAKATAEHLAKLLTVIIRQDRFCDGVMESAYEAGLLTAIVRRASQLCAELTGEGGTPTNKHALPGESGETSWFTRLNTFEQQETRRQVDFKRRRWPELGDGCWSKRLDHFYPHILPVGHEEKSFYPPVARAILDYCRDSDIAVHSEVLNLRSSQACCFNFLFPLKLNLPQASIVLRPLLPDGAEVAAIEFEYTGPDSTTEWLGEPSGGKRGQNRTSIDAAVWWQTARQKGLALVEWKYTEKAFGTCGGNASEGNKQKENCEQTDSPSFDSQCYLAQGRHRRRYWEHLALAGVDLHKLSTVSGCPFRGPFYQLLRQFLLAAHIRAEGDLDVVEVASIGFSGNTSLLLCPPDLRHLGRTTIDAWNSCLSDAPPMKHVTVEELLQQATGGAVDEDWMGYLRDRYGIGRQD